jgi:DNA-binding winged helix-turn-helix (wHTH) protein
MALQTKHLYEFGPFRVHPTERLLLREQHPLQLTAKAFDILLLLVQEHGHLIEKSELMTSRLER